MSPCPNRADFADTLVVFQIIVDAEHYANSNPERNNLETKVEGFYEIACGDEENTPPGGWHNFVRETMVFIDVSDGNREDWATHSRPCEACGGER